MHPAVITRALLRRLFPVAGVMAVSTCSGGPTEPKTVAPSTLVLQQSTTGAVPPGGVAHFQLTAPADSTLLISLQAQTGNASDTLVVEVRSNRSLLASGRSTGTQAALHDAMFALPGGAPLRELSLAVRGAAARHAGAFALMVRTLRVEPERAGSTLVPGTTLSESIDAPGDVDEFTFAGSGSYATSLQLAADSPFADALTAELVDGATVLASVSTSLAQGAIDQLGTAPVSLPRSGNFTVRVRTGAAGSTGSYRLRVSMVPPADPPTPRNLELRTSQIDTLGGTDSVAVYDLSWYPAVIELEASGSNATDTLIASLRRAPLGDTIGTMIVVPGAGAVQRLLPPPPQSNESPIVRVTLRARPQTAAIPFRIRFGSAAGDAPETATPVLVPGDTVDTETFADPIDQDQFFLEAAAGSEWMVMLTPHPEPRGNMSLRIDRPSGVALTTLTAAGLVPDLEMTATYVVMPDSGRYRFTFTAGAAAGDTYRFRVVRIDRGTENAPARFAAGDVISATIGDVGDFDEFRFDGIAGQEVIFRTRPLGPIGQVLTVFDGSTEMSLEPLRGPRLPLDELELRRFFVPRTGEWMIRLHNSSMYGPRTNWPAPYEVEAQLVRRAPETAPADIWAYGDTIQGESIERTGDVDEFTFTLDSARMTRVALFAQRADSLDEIALVVLDPDGAELIALGLGPANGGDGTAAPHVEFTRAGAYRMRVSGSGLGAIPYRVVVTPSFLGPESISDTLLVGNWVSGEAIDSVGDNDRFRYWADSGVRYVPEIERLPGATGRMQFFGGPIYASTAGTRIFGATTVSGWVTSQVLEEPSVEGPAIGPYRLRIRSVSLAPEVAQPTLAIGDSVATESIDLWGDEDHYTFIGAAGDSLRLVARSAAFDTGARLGVIVTAGDGQLVAALPIGATTVAFRLPAAGTYRIRVSGVLMAEDRDLGPYMLTLKRP